VSKLPERFLVLGTGHGVGKTIVTAALAASSRVKVRSLKPITTGVPDNQICPDAEFIADASGHKPEMLYRWTADMPPHRAAAMTGNEAVLGEVLAWIREQQCSSVIVEGYGGWREPIGLNWCVSDVARGLGYPVILVAKNSRDVINRTLLHLDAIRRDGVSVYGVVINETDSLSQEQSARVLHDLSELVPHLPVVWMPYIKMMGQSGLVEAGKKLRLSLG
jgi:dethiobiotin synthetase